MPYKAFLIFKEEMTDIDRKESRYKRRKAARDKRKEAFYSQYNDFDLLTNPDNLFSAWKKSKKEVSWKESVQRYGSNILINISEARNKLINGESISHGFVEFSLRERGKVRHIKSVHISERVVQKCLCDQILVPVLSRSLIYDNGASLKNKGLHFAVRRLKVHLSKFYRKHGSDGYCLSIDFSKYFDNIRHDVLFEKVGNLITNNAILCVYKDCISPFGPGKSLGLGSQVSQISAIFYPSNIDHFIKEKLGIKYYGRYMDDLYLIHADKTYLTHCLEQIAHELETIGIVVNVKKTQIIKLESGIKFLKGKYSLTKTGKILCRPAPDSRKRMRSKLIKFKRLVENEKMNKRDVYSAYQSWRSNYLKRFNAYHTVERMDTLYNQLFIHKPQEVYYDLFSD